MSDIALEIDEAVLGEPIYVRQCDEHESDDGKAAWFRAAARDAHENYGCTFFRYNTHPEIKNLQLIECWLERPAEQGDTRWQLTAPADDKDEAKTDGSV